MPVDPRLDQDTLGHVKIRSSLDESGRQPDVMIEQPMEPALLIRGQLARQAVRVKISHDDLRVESAKHSTLWNRPGG